MANYKYIIIGGGIAGGKAVEGIRQLDEQGSIALVTKEPHRPYQRPPLSKSYLRGEAELKRVFLEDEGYYRGQQTKIIENLAVTNINTQLREILLEDGSKLNYEQLLLATGGKALRLDMPGSKLGNVFTLRTIENSDAIHRAGGKGKTALVMGGSFIGSEVSASLTQIGTQVIQIFPEARLLERVVPKDVSNYLNDLFTQHGIRVQPGTVARSLKGEDNAEAQGNVQRAILDNGEEVAVDTVVMGVGIRLNTGLARDAGLDLQDKDKAVLVDDKLRTSNEHIFAAGDIAAWPDATFERRLRVEHWDVARQQGLQAGRNLAGEDKAYTALPYFFSDLFDLSFEVWGSLDNWDQTATRGSLAKDSFAIYYFDKSRMCGVLSVARPDEEREAMQALVKSRPDYSEIASQITDEKTDLAALAEL